MPNKHTHELHSIYLGLGSNLGDREQNICLSLKYIEDRIGKVVALSKFYETKPVGFVSDNIFLNAACHIYSSLLPLEILSQISIIEKQMGRNLKSSHGIHFDRIIDIDILLYDDFILTLPQLALPHPHLHERMFVLLPLSEIAGEVIHPVLNKTIGEIRSSVDNTYTI